MTKIGFICPTFKAKELREYTELALSSFYEHTPNGVGIVIDDATPVFHEYCVPRYKKIGDHFKLKPEQLVMFSFPERGGLTRSWNKGLTIARNRDLDYCICGNNDIVFTHRWYEGMLHALENGYDLVGPLTNAPGDQDEALVDKYVRGYVKDDRPSRINEIAFNLREQYMGQVVEAEINGFFLLASMRSWIKGMYNKELFFKAFNTHTSKGKRNRTPSMTLNENELQARWLKLDMKACVSLSSFIFHYRSVTRGKRYVKRNQGYRMK